MARLYITLDDEHATKLQRLAEQLSVDEETLARSLLASALDDADGDPHHIRDLLDQIPGAFDRAQRGLDQARRSQTFPLEPT